MREFFKNRIDIVKTDYVLNFGLIVAFVLLICHIWQYYDSHFLIQPLIRVIFYTELCISIFFFGREGLFYSFLFFAYAITLDITFDNYTPFFIITIFTLIKTKSPKIKDNIRLWIFTFLPYIICVLIVCQFHHKDSSHLVIHFLNCFALFFMTFFFVKNKKNIRPLVLDDDQKRILHDIASGKLQKEITYFSKNTITDKLKDAMINNNLLTREQLLMHYIILNSEFN